MIPSYDDFLPDLTDSVMICAFTGWNDAGEAATVALEHVAMLWDSSPYGVIDGEEYFDYQVSRPEVDIRGGVSRELRWPHIQINLAREPRSGRDVVLVSGPEPNYRWRNFAEELLEVARDLDVEKIVLLGGMSTDTHFERPAPVTGSAWDRASAARYGFEMDGYRGPTGIIGVLHALAVQSGIPAISLWVGTPYYISAPAWTPATVELLRRLADVFGEPISLDGLLDAANAEIASVRTLVERDPAMREQIDALTDDLHVNESTGEQLARDFERYLRRKDGETD